MSAKIYLFIISIFLFAGKVSAQHTQPAIGLDPNRPNRGIFPNFGDPAQTLGSIIQNVITLFFTIGALGFIIMFLWGAVSWILSGGDKEAIAGARKRITTAIIGLVLLSLTFVISLVIGQILGIGSLMNRTFTVPRLIP